MRELRSHVEILVTDHIIRLRGSIPSQEARKQSVAGAGSVDRYESVLVAARSKGAPTFTVVTDHKPLEGIFKNDKIFSMIIKDFSRIDSTPKIIKSTLNKIFRYLSFFFCDF